MRTRYVLATLSFLLPALAQATTPEAFCESLFIRGRECMEKIRHNSVDPEALDQCDSVITYKKMDCLDLILNKRFPGRDIFECRSITNSQAKIECLVQASHPVEELSQE